MKKKTEYAIEMLGITKDFGKLRANDDINLRVKKGSIHALIGENGAGKSTLMSILFGLYEPTKGRIKVNGNEFFIKNPNVAADLKIGMVHQHFKLVDLYNAVENISLGSEKTNAKQILNNRLAKKKITALQKKYKMNFDLKKPVYKMNVGSQQKIEIMKMLYRESEVMVFDEPTAVLTPNEIDGLLKSMEHFKSMGKTIIFITHKLNEVMSVADEATIIRKGKTIATVDIKKTSTKKLSEMMVGRALVETKNKSKPPKDSRKILEMKNVNLKKTSTHKSLEDISFDISSGEIVAIAGVDGNGQTELASVISGLLKPTSGKILLNNQNISHWSIKKRYKPHKDSEGKNIPMLSHVPEDRHKYAAVLNFDVATNMVIQTIDEKPYNRYGIIQKNKISNYASKIIDSFDVRGAREGKSQFRSLSGGNQQKAVVGREMNHVHDLLIAAQPTRGLDVGAIEYIHGQILKEKAAGKAILLISYELDEVLSLADKIIVMSEGKISGIRDARKVTKPELGILMAGIKGGKV